MRTHALTGSWGNVAYNPGHDTPNLNGHITIELNIGDCGVCGLEPAATKEVARDKANSIAFPSQIDHDKPVVQLACSTIHDQAITWKDAKSQQRVIQHANTPYMWGAQASEAV
ncbi:MAG: hypothetical protein JL55_39050 [Pseudomonas sp. BICA1-14]|nr:MAG: hypothetical protein JL55_39050 [[Pseudomonas] sp. BICA1-14]